MPLPFTNNRWNGADHDNAGNLKTASGLSATYDVENRLLTANTATYAYDGDGRRVSKTVGGTTTTYVYDAQGNLAAEYGGPVSSLCTTCYLVADALGSTRVVVGGTTGAPVRRYDYLPFGEALPVGIGGRTEAMKYQTSDTLALPDVVSQQFTGQQRDAEVGLGGLDYFEARYFSGAGGRLLSVDPENAGADSGNPQSWNGYAYALNNPFRYTDPTGMSQEDGEPYMNAQGYAQAFPPCQGTVDANGNPCYSVTGTAPLPNGPTPLPAPLNFLEVMFLRSLSSTLPAAQPVAQVMETIGAWVSAPRNPTCTANYTAVGASIGFWAGGGLGTLGLAGGFAAAATIPGGAVGGAALGGGIGGLGGMIMCSSGTWGGSGGGRGGDYREKTRGANANDQKQINAAARQAGVDGRAFGRYVEKIKKLEGRGASENFSFDELVQLAREFKSGSR